MITLELLQERLSGLQVGKAKQLENLAVQDGAIWECEYWIKLLKEEFEASHTVTTLKKSHSKPPQQGDK